MNNGVNIRHLVPCHSGYKSPYNGLKEELESITERIANLLKNGKEISPKLKSYFEVASSLLKHEKINESWYDGDFSVIKFISELLDVEAIEVLRSGITNYYGIIGYRKSKKITW